MEFKVLLNQSKIGTLKEFVNSENRCSNMKKETLFVLQAGTSDLNGLQKEVEAVDLALTGCEDSKTSGYLRLNALDSFLDQEERIKYGDLYQHWLDIKGDKRYYEECFVFQFQNTLWENVYKDALLSITEEYQNVMKSDMKLKNLVILLFKWVCVYFPKIFTSTRTLSKFPKFLYIGSIKTNEYLFMKLLALCGCDVFAISNQREMQIKMQNLSFYAQITQLESDINIRLPEYNAEMIEAQRRKIVIKRENDVRIERNKEKDNVKINTNKTENSQVIPANNTPAGTGRILEYVELAKLASSIVLITVYNKNREVFASGSGVLINGNGYILTNFHVVNGGVSFGVRLEDEEELKFTSELIKYHPEFDLALLRIDPVDRKPILTYKGGALARGEKVVAIGSPLGLFNTVSDGIIAGFRDVNHVSMIQFTAPISHGSSGGALLNLCGELVGIVTSGFDDGQNLNLAVEFGTVNSFLRGFI